MNAEAVLLELLGRIAARPGGSIHITNDELAQWPQVAVAACKADGLIKPASPATGAVCSGCERLCFMPVEVRHRDPPNHGAPPVAFVVCDKRSDIGRVEVPITALERWRTDAQVLADMLGSKLGMAKGAVATNAGRHWHLGVLQGKKHKSPLALHCTVDEGPKLTLAGHTTLVSDVLTIKAGKLAVDAVALLRQVDAPVGNEAADAEDPDARYQRLKNRVEQERANGTKAFLQVVADAEGIHKSRLQQILKRPAKTGGAIGAMASALAGPLLKGKGRR